MNLDVKKMVWLKKRIWLWLPWLIIAWGLYYRFDQYFFNPSLWLDEALVAVNVINRTFSEILKAPLEYSSYIAPPGFLVMAKLLTVCFGNSDLILRLFPFCCGVLSLLFYYPMAKHYISEAAVPLALFFFALSKPLIYYSSVFKQYSSDVLIVIILLWIVPAYRSYVLTPLRLTSLAAVGSIVVWFSHPSVFILATIGIYIIYPYLMKHQWYSAVKLVTIYLIWLLNFVLLYFLFIHVATPNDKWLHKFWVLKNAFMPSPFSSQGIEWLCNTFESILKFPGGFENFQLAGCLLAIGCVALSANRKGTLFLLLLPVLIALLVSYSQQYAFSSRLLLFVLPALYLIISESIVQLHVMLLTYPKRTIVSVIAQIILVTCLIDYPIYRRRVIQDIKPVFDHIQQNIQAQDCIYLYYWVEPVFRCYAASYNVDYEACHIITPMQKHEYTKEVDYFRSKQGLKPAAVSETQCILGISEFFDKSKPDLDQLRGSGRVWFIFSHISKHKRSLFLNYLDSMGARIDENLQPGASAHLYDLY